MELPTEVRAAFQRQGRKGGQARARKLSADARRTIARQAAIRRWIRVRFGDTSFTLLRLPGGELVDAGLDDLAANRVTPASLVVSLAAPRLRREGVPLPRTCFPDAEWKLFRLLEELHGELAHARFLAHLRQAESFANACHVARVDGGRHAR
ncbi:MAG: hypothetical protein ACYTEG_05675 [Planctomycetota bacterium]|jgi:hypothetical protein